MSETKKLKLMAANAQGVNHEKFLLKGLSSIATSDLDHLNNEGIFALKRMRQDICNWDFSLWLKCAALMPQEESFHLFRYKLIDEKMTRLVPPEKWKIENLIECMLPNQKTPGILWDVFFAILPRCQNKYLHQMLWTRFRPFLPFPETNRNVYRIFKYTHSSWLAQTLLDAYPDHFLQFDFYDSFNEVAQLWELERCPNTRDQYAGISASRDVWNRTMNANDPYRFLYLNVLSLKCYLEVRPKSWTDEKVYKMIHCHAHKKIWIECFEILQHYGIRFNSYIDPKDRFQWHCALLSFGYYTGPISQVKDRYLVWSNALSKQHFSPEAKQIAKTALLVLVRMGLGMGFRDLREAIVTRVMNAYVKHLRWLKWGDVACRF